MSDEQGYAWLQAGADRHGLDPLPAWRDVPADTQEQVLAVLRRLALSRAIDPEDGLGSIEQEVGIGEDRALRVHLLLTCFEMLAELGGDHGPGAVEETEASAADPVHGILSELLGESTLAGITDRCWVYRDQPLIKWDGLDQVQAGFSGSNGEDLDRLATARRRWDELDADGRLREITAVMRAVMRQYSVGAMPFGRTTHNVWGNVALLRKFSEAARADRINLLSHTAFASLRDGDLPTEAFQGVAAFIDGDELFVCRSELDGADIEEWASALASWKPRAEGAGEAVFAWEWGGALVTPQPFVDQLESWLQEALGRLVARQVEAEPAATADAA